MKRIKRLHQLRTGTKFFYYIDDDEVVQIVKKRRIDLKTTKITLNSLYCSYDFWNFYNNERQSLKIRLEHKEVIYRRNATLSIDNWDLKHYYNIFRIKKSELPIHIYRLWKRKTR